MDKVSGSRKWTGKNNNNANINVYGYGSVIMTIPTVRVYLVHLTNADLVPDCCQLSNQANQHGMWVHQHAATINICRIWTLLPISSCLTAHLTSSSTVWITSSLRLRQFWAASLFLPRRRMSRMSWSWASDSLYLDSSSLNSSTDESIISSIVSGICSDSDSE